MGCFTKIKNCILKIKPVNHPALQFKKRNYFWFVLFHENSIHFENADFTISNVVILYGTGLYVSYTLL